MILNDHFTENTSTMPTRIGSINIYIKTTWHADAIGINNKNLIVFFFNNLFYSHKNEYDSIQPLHLILCRPPHIGQSHWTRGSKYIPPI